MTDSERPRYGTGPKGLRRNRPRRSREEIEAEKNRASPPRRKNPISWPLRALRFSPQRPKNRVLLAPSLSMYGIALGVAFELLVRAQLQRINPDAIVGRWLVEEALEFAQKKLDESGYLQEESDWVVESLSGKMTRLRRYSKDPKNAIARLYELLDITKTLQIRFIADGVVSHDLLEGYLKLARLQGRFVRERELVIPYNLDQVDSRAIHELKFMFDQVDWSRFKANKRCLLRPQFRRFSDPGINEPDLVIDDMIVDLKASKSSSLDRNDIDSLLKYFALAKLDGLKGQRKGGINRLALYFARYADWLVIDMRKDYPPEKIEKYLAWYREKKLSN